MTFSVRQMAAALGVSKSQVARDKDAGMPMHDAEAARAWRLAQHDLSRMADTRIDRPAAQSNHRSGEAGMPAGEGGASAPPSIDEDAAGADADTIEFRSARAARERTNAKRAQIELEQLQGRLVDRDEVARLRFTEFRSLRDAIGNVGARIKDQLAIETDALKCEALVNDELAQVLSAFADQVMTRGVTQDEDDDEPA